ASACSRDGRFRFREVPDGHYALKVWHEVDGTLRKEKEFEVKGGGAVDLKTISVTGPAIAALAAGAAPVRAWPEVIDRIGMRLSESLIASRRPQGGKRARTLADDAYFGEFEASEMETAVRTYLGFERAGELEGQFR